METNKKEWATKGERSETVVHADNLKLEGQMQGEHHLVIVFHASMYLSNCFFQVGPKNTFKVLMENVPKSKDIRTISLWKVSTQ